MTEEQREIIVNGFYDSGNVENQREWISRNVEVKDPKYARLRKDSRKSRTFDYFLPTADCRKVQVCREMFLNTLNISDRQIRTTVEKLSSDG